MSPSSPIRGRHALTVCVTLLGALLVSVTARPAWAHTGEPLAPHDLRSAWCDDPAALALIGLACWLYARGCGAMWARAGTGRGIPRWRFWCYSAGMIVLLLALVSPLDPLGGALFSAHMVQHELLIMVAAPLMVLGYPLVAFARALPGSWRKPVGRWMRGALARALWGWLSRPAVAWSLYAAAIWLWHAPRLYQAALTSDPVHLLQHLSFFATALLFWWTLLHPNPHRRLAPGLAVLYLFTTSLHGSALGAFLNFSHRPWYPAYEEGAALWGLTLLEDQQLGGLIMWIPFGALYTAVALALLGQWLGLPGKQARQAAARPASRA